MAVACLTQPTPTSDGAIYLSLSDRLAQGLPYQDPDGHRAFWPPGLPAVLHAFLSLPLLRWFGRCSFSLYLWQQPFFNAIQSNPGIPRPLLAAGALLAGALSFYAFEDPVRVRLNRAWARRPRLAFALPAAPDVEEDMTRDPG